MRSHPAPSAAEFLDQLDGTFRDGDFLRGVVGATVHQGRVSVRGIGFDDRVFRPCAPFGGAPVCGSSFAYHEFSGMLGGCLEQVLRHSICRYGWIVLHVVNQRIAEMEVMLRIRRDEIPGMWPRLLLPYPDYALEIWPARQPPPPPHTAKRSGGSRRPASNEGRPRGPHNREDRNPGA